MKHFLLDMPTSLARHKISYGRKIQVVGIHEILICSFFIVQLNPKVIASQIYTEEFVKNIYAYIIIISHSIQLAFLV